LCLFDGTFSLRSKKTCVARWFSSVVRAEQVHGTGKKDYETPEGVRVRPTMAFLRELV